MPTTYEIPDTYYHTFEAPYFALRLLLYPKEQLQNIKPYDITFAYLLSKNEIKIFYYYTEYYEYSWGQYKPYSKVEWENFSCKLNDLDDLRKQLDLILSKFEQFIIDNLKEEFNITN